MQQEKRRRVFRAGLSVKDGEPIDLYRAIKSRVFHGMCTVLPDLLWISEGKGRPGVGTAFEN